MDEEEISVVIEDGSCTQWGQYFCRLEAVADAARALLAQWRPSHDWDGLIGALGDALGTLDKEE